MVFDMSRKIKIFGYGSLVNESSLKRTVPGATNIFPAMLYGFRRVFNLASHHRICVELNAPVCVLNVEQCASEQVMNGTCFEMEAESFDALLERERIYSLHDVRVHHYYDEKDSHEAKLFWARKHEPYAYLSNSEEQNSYLNLCLQGCAVYGQRFIDDFKSSTSFWGMPMMDNQAKIWQGGY